MKKYWVWAILISMSLFWAGCESDDDGSSSEETAASATSDGGTSGSDAASASSDSAADTATSSDSAADAASNSAAAEPEPADSFADIVPSGLKVKESYTIAGRGTMYVLACDAIEGAVSYTFMNSFGSGSTGPLPQAQFLRQGIDNDFSFTVTAKNADGVVTQTATKSVDVP